MDEFEGRRSFDEGRDEGRRTDALLEAAALTSALTSAFTLRDEDGPVKPPPTLDGFSFPPPFILPLPCVEDPPLAGAFPLLFPLEC